MKTQDQVFKVLKYRAEARDNDNYLCWLVWHNFYKDSMSDMMTFRDDFINNKIPSADSITRYRRKIQEEHIELRGKKYNERQNKTKKVKRDLNYYKKIEAQKTIEQKMKEAMYRFPNIQ